MNSKEILDALQSHHVTQEIFVGVYAADQIAETFGKIPSACIVNTDPSSKPGQHWVAIFQDQTDTVEFFDSYGKQPDFFLFTNFPRCSRIIKQNSVLQSNITSVCGQYCMFFLFKRCTGVLFPSIIKSFSFNKMENDFHVQSFINHIFHLKTKTVDIDLL